MDSLRGRIAFLRAWFSKTFSGPYMSALCSAKGRAAASAEVYGHLNTRGRPGQRDREAARFLLPGSISLRYLGSVYFGSTQGGPDRGRKIPGRPMGR